MSWASRRRTTYISFVVIIALIIIGPIVYFALDEEPTCFDNKQNGDERGIDCGGSCPELCVSQISDPVVIWSRAFKVVDGVYNTVAYVENPNFNAGVEKISYIFKLFDDENILVTERKGSTFITPNNISPIFEGAIQTGQRIPTKAFFEFRSAPTWSDYVDKSSDLSVTDTALLNPDSSPRVDTTLSNTSILDIKNIEVVAILFDARDNAVAVSSTFIDVLPNRSSRDLVFTWPNKFDSTVSRIEILPRIPVK